jgi:hypothetical protein
MRLAHPGACEKRVESSKSGLDVKSEMQTSYADVLISCSNANGDRHVNIGDQILKQGGVETGIIPLRYTIQRLEGKIKKKCVVGISS